jgi:biopolymer transport protein TolQ
MDQAAIQSVAATTMATSAAPEGLSLWMLFWQAAPIIKLVIIVLLAASFWCWTIIFQKIMRLRRLHSTAEQFEEAFWSGGSLDDLYDRINNRPHDPLSAIFCSAMREWRRSISKGLASSNDSRGTLQQRIERVMQLTVDREMERLGRHMGFLASTGSAATFVGLFGTVLGIMNSFQALATQQNANLTVTAVAPGIAEALFATAVGLVVAIPAMIAYNKLSGDLNRYANRLDAFSTEFSAIISRQFEEQA